MAQLQNFFNVGAVIPLWIVSFIRGAGYPGAIEGAAQVAVVRMGSDRMPGREIERQPVAVEADVQRVAAGALDNRGGQALQAGRVVQVESPGIG